MRETICKHRMALASVINIRIDSAENNLRLGSTAVQSSASLPRVTPACSPANSVRVRIHRNQLIPVYIHVEERDWREVATHLLEVFRTLTGKTRGEAEEELRETVGDHPSQLVQQGMAKLLEDRCEFEVDSEHPPDEIREKVFLAAGAARRGRQFDRSAILNQAAVEMAMTAEDLDRGLFADLKSEQRIVRFEDCTVDQLLHRYNVALAQAVLLRATSVTVKVHGEAASRYRQLFRAIKFHRLICEIQPSGAEAVHAQTRRAVEPVLVDAEVRRATGQFPAARCCNARNSN